MECCRGELREAVALLIYHTSDVLGAMPDPEPGDRARCALASLRVVAQRCMTAWRPPGLRRVLGNVALNLCLQLMHARLQDLVPAAAADLSEHHFRRAVWDEIVRLRCRLLKDATGQEIVRIQLYPDGQLTTTSRSTEQVMPDAQSAKRLRSEEPTFVFKWPSY